jgi:hypothetical protein
MFDYYLALRDPEQSGLLGWSALPYAPVQSSERPRRPASRLRRGIAWALVGLAKRLDPQAGRLGPNRVHARPAPTY